MRNPIRLLAAIAVLGLPGLAGAQAPEHTNQELSANFFRNPSIGLEYRIDATSFHVGAYPTKILPRNSKGRYPDTWFVRAGATRYFLPYTFYGSRPSEAYVSVSYLRKYTQGRGDAAIADAGYRWMVWKGLNVRFGASVLIEEGEKPKVRPTPGIGWAHAF